MILNLKKEILKKVTEHYLNSLDFNGIPVNKLVVHFNISLTELNIILKELVNKDKIDLRFGDFHPNAHIQALFEYPKIVLLEIMTEQKIQHSCIYPTKKHLTKIVDKKKYDGKPFSLKLALGFYQLNYEAFDLSILEMYRNDPRYYFINSDIQGQIYYSNSRNSKKNNPDNIYLQEYGFCFNKKNERAIAVFLTRLSGLTPEHQQMWNAKKLKGKFLLHPDFYKMSRGHLPEGISIFGAFIKEQEKINKICKIIGIPPLFKKIFTLRDKPKEFTFLIRPTLREYENFIHILDKMVSENINVDFFQNRIELEKEETRKDGKIITRKKGSIELLDEWLHIYYHHPDTNLIKKTLAPFRKLRRLRQLPAHTLSENEYSQKYFKEQKELMSSVHNAILGIRYILQYDPNVTNEQRESFETKLQIWLQ